MSEERTNEMLNKIEKLILNGNKEVIGYIDRKVDEVKQEFKGEIGSLDKKIGGLDRKLDSVHSSLKKEISVTAQASYGLRCDGDLEGRMEKVEARVS